MIGIESVDGKLHRELHHDFTLIGVDWQRLAGFIESHGGACHEYCTVPTSTPGKLISIYEVQPDVLGIAVSPNSAAALKIAPGQRWSERWPHPIWIRLGGHALDDSVKWPVPVRVLASSLRPAKQVMFSAGKTPSGGLELRRDATFATERIAEIVRTQLELQTKMLNLEFAREHAKPDTADLSGLLSSGTFQLIDDNVVGIWPVHNELIRSLQLQ